MAWSCRHATGTANGVQVVSAKPTRAEKQPRGGKPEHEDEGSMKPLKGVPSYHRVEVEGMYKARLALM